MKKCNVEGCTNKIFGKGFCKFHYPKKEINKISEAGKIKREEKKERTDKQTEFFLEIWKERPHVCQVCGRKLGKEPLSIYFDHLIEKSRRKDLQFVKDNIILVCGDCHLSRTNGFPKEKHKKAIDETKRKYGG